MELLRTPEDAWADITDHPSAVDEVGVPDGDGGTLDVAVVRAGPTDGPIVVCLHGEPTWSYLYRHVIDALVTGGAQVVAPDLVGFGRSDKPTKQSDHTYRRHVDWIGAALFAELGLGEVHLLCQDWGGLIGLRLVGEQPERFASVVAANTFLPTGDGAPSDAFLAWQRYSQEVPEMPIGRIVDRGSVRSLSPAEVTAYDAPFPDESFKAGPRQMPLLVPTRPDDPGAVDNRSAWEGLSRYDRPFVCAFSDQDPVTAGSDRALIRRIAGAGHDHHVTLAGGGHFLQEDVGPALAGVVLSTIDRTTTA